jgi:ATP-dependent DNA helicase DinG
MSGWRAEEVETKLAQVVAQVPVGEIRPGQLAMAEAVARALDRSSEDPPTTVAVAAGTGTGKSFAYLVPVALSGKRVVVATATKALQDQLAAKDLPLVRKGLRSRLRWAVLKGRSNYLCRQRLNEIEALGRQGSLEEAGTPPPSTGATRGGRRAATIGEQVARLVKWSASTVTGDRGELDFEPLPQAWSSVSVTADECPGAQRCPSGADCFAEKARAKASSAEVIVVNMHLLGAHLRSGGAVLPEHDALVVDEAHELEDVMASSLGVEVSPGRIRGIAAGARSALRDPSVAEDVMNAVIRFERTIEASTEKRLPAGLGADIGDAVRLLSQRLTRLEKALRAETAETRSAPGRRPGRGGEPDREQKAQRSLLATERLREELDSCLAAGDGDVVFVSGGDRPSLRSAPLDVSATLSAQLFDEMPVVLTSATMAPGLARRLGAPAERVTEIDVGSPFDYEHNALLYCAVRLPDRRKPGSESALHDEICTLVEAAGGRTLGLFTSKRAMEAAAAALRPRIDWPIHLQGELPKAALLEAFSKEEEACLFATMGFWQGVDVPGPSLSLVVIDKLPFPRPDDPLFSARREAAGAAGFRAVDLPRAATLLAQGAGRLVRSATDRGVVAVLDPRLATASYSGYLVKALPRMRRTKDRDEAVAFLRALHAAAPGAD